MLPVNKLLRGVNLQTVAVTAGVVVVAPIAIAALSGGLKPLARGVVKSGMRGYNQARIWAAEAREMADDMLAEVQHEMQSEEEEQVVTEAPAEKPTKGATKDKGAKSA